MTALFLAVDLQIREHGLPHRVPIDHAQAAVDQPLFVEAHKRLVHRAVQALVEGKSLALPIAGRAHALELIDDLPAMLGLPGPGALHEFGAPDLVAIGALFGELTLDHDLDRKSTRLNSSH